MNGPPIRFRRYQAALDSACNSRPRIVIKLGCQKAGLCKLNADESVALDSLDGTITAYRVGQDGSLDPVRTGIGSAVDVTGLAPVLVRNADGTFAVTSKNATSVFTL